MINKTFDTGYESITELSLECQKSLVFNNSRIHLRGVGPSRHSFDWYSKCLHSAETIAGSGSTTANRHRITGHPAPAADR